MKLRTLLPLLVLIGFSATALASGGGHAAAEGDHGIPWHSIFVQAANLGGLLLLLGFILRKTVASFFSERRQVYLDLVQKADSAKLEAEQNRREIASRIENLAATTEQSLRQASAEAGELRNRILMEAKELSEKLKKDTDRSVEVELEKAKFELRKSMLEMAVDAARKTLQEKVGGAEQKRLQDEFVDKIQVVR